jgi:hypothetical protein
MEQAPDYVLGLAGVSSLDAKGALDAPPGEPTRMTNCHRRSLMLDSGGTGESARRVRERDTL